MSHPASLAAAWRYSMGCGGIGVSEARGQGMYGHYPPPLLPLRAPVAVCWLSGLCQGCNIYLNPMLGAVGEG